MFYFRSVFKLYYLIEFQGGRTVANRPYLQILDPHMKKFEEVSSDALSIRGFQEYRCNDYHLGNKASLIFQLIYPFQLYIYYI